MKIDFDVTIIGAGPSGCACALALEGKGLKVALIDKDVFPRDKICGDAIPGPSFEAINSLNRNWGDQMKAFTETMPVTASSAYLSGEGAITHEWLTYSYNSKRIDFDNFLFDLVKKETDTTTFENKKLQKITTGSNYYCCEFQDDSSIVAAIVVGCDGANSMVKRQLIHGHSTERKPVASVRAYFRGVEGIKMGENEFHFLDTLDGYFWIFPLQNDLANVGFGIYKNGKKRNRSPIDLRKTFEEIIHSPLFADRFKNATPMDKVKGFGLPIWTKKRTVSGNRFLLCGDAASLIDPLQGHGIDKAIWSGILAAKQIAHCFQENDFSAACMKQYDAMLYDKFGPELSRKYLVMQMLIRFPFLKNIVFKLLFRQWLTNWVIRKLKI